MVKDYGLFLKEQGTIEKQHLIITPCLAGLLAKDQQGYMVVFTFFTDEKNKFLGTLITRQKVKKLIKIVKSGQPCVIEGYLNFSNSYCEKYNGVIIPIYGTIKKA